VIFSELHIFELSILTCSNISIGFEHKFIDTPGTPVSSTNKTDVHDLTEILLKVALKTKNTIPI